MRDIFETTRQIAEHLLQLFCIGTGAENPLLRATQLGSGDGFHRLRELLRVLDRANPPPDV